MALPSLKAWPDECHLYTFSSTATPIVSAAEGTTATTPPPAAAAAGSTPKKRPAPTQPQQKEEGNAQKRTARKRRRAETFALYIYKVLKQMHPDTGISRKSMNIMNSFVLDMLDQLTSEAVVLMLRQGRKTLGSRELQTAARLLLPGELAKHAICEAGKAVSKFVT